MNFISKWTIALRGLNWSALRPLTVSSDLTTWLESYGHGYTPETLEPVMNSLRLAAWQRKAGCILSDALPFDHFKRGDEVIYLPQRQRA